MKRNPPNLSILDLDSTRVVDLALHILQQRQVQLVEWRAPLYGRMQAPMMGRVYSYAVPDHDFERASTALSDIGLPLSTPTYLQLQTLGDFRAKAHYHWITHPGPNLLGKYLALYPFSFTTFSFSELVETPLSLTSSPLCSSILVPTQHAVYGSLIRMMLRYPKYQTRTQLNSDLAQLILYNMYGSDGHFVDTSDEEVCGAPHDDEDEGVADAIALVRRWNLEGYWREGEEWIGDALLAIVGGTTEMGHSHIISQANNSCYLCTVLDGW